MDLRAYICYHRYLSCFIHSSVVWRSDETFQMFLGGIWRNGAASSKTGDRSEIFSCNQWPVPPWYCKLQYYVTVSPAFGKLDSSPHMRPRQKSMWFTELDPAWASQQSVLSFLKRRDFNIICSQALNILLIWSESSNDRLQVSCLQLLCSAEHLLFTPAALLLVWKATVCLEKTSEDEREAVSKSVGVLMWNQHPKWF